MWSMYNIEIYMCIENEREIEREDTIQGTKAKPTMWPVLHTMVSHYVHKTRQWDVLRLHFTLPIAVWPLSPFLSQTQKRTHGSLRHNHLSVFLYLRPSVHVLYSRNCVCIRIYYFLALFSTLDVCVYKKACLLG